MMSRIFGLVLAGGLVLGAASESKAQFGLGVGNPYYGGSYIGSGGYYGAPGFAYRSGYAGLVAAPSAYGYGVPAYGGVYRGGFGYRPYGYGGYGYRRGWGVGRGWGRGFRRW